MPFPKESIYDIIGVSPAATLPEIMRAYQQAVKSGRYPPQVLAQAFSDLRNTRKRAEADLFTYTATGDERQIADVLSALPPPAFLPAEVMPAPIPLSLTDLANPDRTADFAPPPECPLSFLPSERYRPSMDVLPPPSLPV